MNRVLRIGIFSSAVFILLMVTAYYLVNRSMGGMLDYYWWKSVNSDAGNGAYASVNGATLYYEIHGQGEPLLLLHGGLAFIESFHNQIPALAERFKVIAVDSRAHGRSSEGDQPISYGLMGEDMLALIDSLGISKVHVVGWSDGGIIGLDMAMKRPLLVDTLVVIGSSYHWKGYTDAVIEENNTLDAEDDALVPYREIYESMSPSPERWSAFIADTRNMWSTEPSYSTDQLNEIEAKTLAIVGERDDIKLAHSQEMVATIPNAKLLVVPGASHLVPTEKPQEVNSQILSFLQQ